MATSGFPQLRPSFVLSAGLTGGPKTSNHSWSLEGSWNAELEWTCLHTTHDATHVSRVGAFSSENRVQIASLHLAISKQTTIISTNPLWLMKAISLWVAIVQYPIKQTWWVAHKDRTLHRCGKDCPLHELRSSPTALLDLEPCKPYMDSAWYGWGMPNLSVLSYCPFRICPYHPLSLSKISYWLAGHWSSYCRHEIWYDTTAHIHRWNVCRIIKQEIWKYMDMLWVKTLNSRGVVANRPFTSTYRPLTANLHIATLGYLGHHWSLGGRGILGIDLEARLSMFPRKPLKRFILHLRCAAEPLGDYEMERWKHDWFILIHAISKQHVHQATNLRSIHRKCFNRDVQSQLPSLPHIIFLREASHEPAMTIEIHEVCCNLHQHVAPFMDREASK